MACWVAVWVSTGLGGRGRIIIIFCLWIVRNSIIVLRKLNPERESEKTLNIICRDKSLTIVPITVNQGRSFYRGREIVESKSDQTLDSDQHHFNQPQTKYCHRNIYTPKMIDKLISAALLRAFQFEHDWWKNLMLEPTFIIAEGWGNL